MRELQIRVWRWGREGSWNRVQVFPQPNRVGARNQRAGLLRSLSVPVSERGSSVG